MRGVSNLSSEATWQCEPNPEAIQTDTPVPKPGACWEVAVKVAGLLWTLQKPTQRRSALLLFLSLLPLFFFLSLLPLFLLLRLHFLLSFLRPSVKPSLFFCSEETKHRAVLFSTFSVDLNTGGLSKKSCDVQTT